MDILTLDLIEFKLRFPGISYAIPATGENAGVVLSVGGEAVLGYASPSSINLAVTTTATALYQIKVEVLEAFDGAAQASVGIDGSPEKYVTAEQMALNVTGARIIEISLILAPPSETIMIFYAANFASKGAAKFEVIVTTPSALPPTTPSANTTPFATDQMILMCFDLTTSYISNENYGWLNGNDRLNAMYYMAAHLVFLALKASVNQQIGVVTNVGQGSESVGFTAIPDNSRQLRHWLNQTFYGQAYRALIQSHSSGGVYIGGSPVQSAIRKYNGRL